MGAVELRRLAILSLHTGAAARENLNGIDHMDTFTEHIPEKN
jgi:hypothetical protein